MHVDLFIFSGILDVIVVLFSKERVIIFYEKYVAVDHDSREIHFSVENILMLSGTC